MSNDGLNPKDVIAWHLARAKFHTEVAESLRKEYALTVDETGDVKPRTAVTLHDVQKILNERSARIADLAKILETNEAILEALIARPDSHIVKGERGWLEWKNP